MRPEIRERYSASDSFSGTAVTLATRLAAGFISVPGVKYSETATEFLLSEEKYSIWSRARA